MSGPISSNSPQVPITPKRAADPAPSKPEASRPTGDRLQLGRALSPSLIEADLRLSMVGNTQLAADGTVTLQKALLERLVRHAVRGSKEITDARIGFDAASGTYAVEAKVAVKGLQLPLSLKLAPVIDSNAIGFQFREVAIPTRLGSLESSLITRKLTEAIAHEMSRSGIRNTTDPKQGLIRIDTNGLLNHLGVLPTFVGLDFEKTRLSMNVAPDGNVVVGMKSAQRAPAISDTPASDIAVFADEKALQQVLRHALGRDFEVEKVTLGEGGLKLDGRAEYKEGSEVLTAGKALFLILAIAARDPVANQIGTDPARMMIPLALDVKQEGTRLVITPSIQKALGPLAESIKKAGFNPVPEGKGLRIDLDEVWQGHSATFDQLRVRSEGADARMRLDIDSFINAPWLKDDVRS